MKKSLTIIALSSIATGIYAQSTAEVFGVVDVGIARLSGTGVEKTGMESGAANISRIGFRGIEDMGEGLKAGYWLEAGLNVNTGASPVAASAGGLEFNRRSTVSLIGNFGEIRLGRDDSATFLTPLLFDPFLTNGVGGTMSFIMQGAPLQYNNVLGYFLPPKLGGFYGEVQYAFGGSASNVADPQAGHYYGARVGYKTSMLDVVFASGKLYGATHATDDSINNLGASYDFGAIKPMLIWATESVNGIKVSAEQLGFTAPIGSGVVRASYGVYSNSSNSALDWKKIALGYGYNLSKRTQLYGTIARVSNSSGIQKAINPQGLGSVGTSLGGSSSGVEVGIRHFF